MTGSRSAATLSAISQQRAVGLIQIVRQRLLHVAPKEISQPVKYRAHSPQRRAIQLDGAQIVIARGDEQIRSRFNRLMRETPQEVAGAARLVEVIAARGAFMGMDRHDHQARILPGGADVPFDLGEVLRIHRIVVREHRAAAKFHLEQFQLRRRQPPK